MLFLPAKLKPTGQNGYRQNKVSLALFEVSVHILENPCGRSPVHLFRNAVGLIPVTEVNKREK